MADLMEYKSNSNKSKIEANNATEHKVEKDVTGKIITKKKSEKKKFTDEFI